jgi:hypothetical protein
MIRKIPSIQQKYQNSIIFHETIPYTNAKAKCGVIYCISPKVLVHTANTYIIYIGFNKLHAKYI